MINKDKDCIFFNYPIPKTIHRRVRELSAITGLKVKDIVINALVMYLDHMFTSMDEGEEKVKEDEGADLI